MANKVYNDVWDAVGIKPDKAKSLDIRSDLMIELTDFIEDKEFTQKKAAEFFGVSQPRISNLVHGRISLFTIDFLVELCVKAGIEVKFTVGSTVYKDAKENNLSTMSSEILSYIDDYPNVVNFTEYKESKQDNLKAYSKDYLEG